MTGPDKGEQAGPDRGAATGNVHSDRQAELGMMFTHSVMSATTQELLAAASSLYALIDLLLEQGVIDRDDLNARREAMLATLSKKVEESGLGFYLNQQHPDKYAMTDLPEIDCAERIPLCQAACCKLRFPLSRQDVEEGTVRWDLGQPYWNLQTREGYCVHCDVDDRHCAVYEKRPAPCRAYDCRQDERIWIDFDAMIVNPDLEEAIRKPLLPAAE
jgi:Fe-S-cluster containining protein